MLNNAKSLTKKENYCFRSDIYESIRSFLHAYAIYYELTSSIQSVPELGELTVHLKSFLEPAGCLKYFLEAQHKTTRWKQNLTIHSFTFAVMSNHIILTWTFSRLTLKVQILPAVP